MIKVSMFISLVELKWHEHNIKIKPCENYESKPLPFSIYPNQNINENIINVLEFDSQKVSIFENETDLIILYDRKSFKLKIKAFCGMIKQSKEFIRNKNIKVMNELASMKLLGVFCYHTATSLSLKKKNRSTF